MDVEHNEVCQFLKSWPGQFVSGKEVCRRAGGKWRYREDKDWALPILRNLFENNLVEKDSTGHFRLLTPESSTQKNKKRLWMSPAIKTILRQSGRDFTVIDLDKEPGLVEGIASAEEIFLQPVGLAERSGAFPAEQR